MGRCTSRVDTVGILMDWTARRSSWRSWLSLTKSQSGRKTNGTHLRGLTCQICLTTWSAREFFMLNDGIDPIGVDLISLIYN